MAKGKTFPHLITHRWTSNQNESFLAATSQMMSDWQLINHTIALCHIKEQHTARNLHLSLEKISDNWRIKKAVVSHRMSHLFQIQTQRTVTTTNTTQTGTMN